ncbi:hypothetical protein DB346_13935 [Verrucomicrobia bacterium LW23]|nr:hypothetical protein DB346_13935 [Verrucomicrobia bacterium LW23]
MEAADNYAIIHADTSTQILRQTLSELERELAPQHFLRVSRGAIVNLVRVAELTSDAAGRCVLKMQSGRTIPVTRTRTEIENGIRKLVHSL